MSDMCQYPNCRCPFDMGPDNLCLIGKQHPNTRSIESMPERWRLITKKNCYQLVNGNEVVATLAGPDSEEYAEKLARLLTTTQPAYNWIKCSERLPTEADCDANGEVWWLTPNEKGDMTVITMQWSFGSPSDRGITLLDEATHWMPTGLKRPNPPAEGAE